MLILLIIISCIYGNNLEISSIDANYNDEGKIMGGKLSVTKDELIKIRGTLKDIENKLIDSNIKRIENLSMKLGIISSAANSIADMAKSTRQSTMRSDENQYTGTVDMRTQFIAMEESVWQRKH